jgi:hypothetical protein
MFYCNYLSYKKFRIEVSDGYAKLKKCAIMYEKNDKRPKLKLFDVFRV